MSKDNNTLVETPQEPQDPQDRSATVTVTVTGWQCPVCLGVWSPWTDRCLYCSAKGYRQVQAPPLPPYQPYDPWAPNYPGYPLNGTWIHWTDANGVGHWPSYTYNTTGTKDTSH